MKKIISDSEKMRLLMNNIGEGAGNWIWQNGKRLYQAIKQGTRDTDAMILKNYRKFDRPKAKKHLDTIKNNRVTQQNHEDNIQQAWDDANKAWNELSPAQQIIAKAGGVAGGAYGVHKMISTDNSVSESDQSKKTFDNYYKNIWGQSHTAIKQSQAKRNQQSNLTAPRDVYTKNDLKLDTNAAILKLKELEKMYSQLPAGRNKQTIVLNKIINELESFDRYMFNQFSDINGYGIQFDGIEDKLSDKHLANISSKQKQVRVKKQKINDYLEKHSLGTIDFI